ncbi:hypothetical protein [Streptomyces sp. NPDC047014]|uniref:hypothetical protein n=1 Tax=Streptomyces sp. NPDC047014 TaxID=3155736 RepID=UPI0033F7881E
MSKKGAPRGRSALSGGVEQGPPASGPLEPVPRPGCGVCAANGQDRELARAAGDTARVRSLSAELENHHAGEAAVRLWVRTGEE